MQKLLAAFLFVICSCVFCFAQDSPPKPTPTPAPGSGNGIGNGSGTGSGSGSGETNAALPSNPAAKIRGIRIISKPRANYTEAAKLNHVEGVVRVRVTFMASGEIGSTIPISGLPFGLTEQALAAARRIKFEPATRDDIPVSVTKVVEYNFSIYYRENDPDLAKNAEILVMPAPEHPQKEDLRNVGGKVRVKVVFETNRTLRVVEVSSDLPKDFQDAARKAASQIKFDPAIHKNGNAVTQSKVIEYEFKPQND
ncbi:MAG TPA: energy transducer TonB [Pyrinomonadaceae bacterium]|jgi:TonB family protein